LTNTGTPYYASPEIWLDNECTDKSDMWSMGCVLYELACLRVPFKGKDMKVLKQRILNGKFV
jgi:NIMA (never in mitosis gene a)-related kinase